MDISIFFAKFLGLYLTILSIGLLITRKNFLPIGEEFVGSRPLIFLTGLLSLLFGLVIILLNNVWWGWPLIVTLLGWLLVIRGLIRLFWPEWSRTIIGKFLSSPKAYYITFIITLILGLILLYFGFVD